jgi:ribosomal subunit interface protein
MKITLTGKQVDIGDRLRGHVEENIQTTVNKYFGDPISTNINLSKEGEEEFRADVTVHPAKGVILNGSGVAGDPYSAFDAANTHIATRLRRHKNKLNDHKGKDGFSELANISVFSEESEEEEVEYAPITIAETDTSVLTCTVSEAIMHMDLADENAIMFRNTSNNQLNMVYRRKDGNIGWIDPKSTK